MNPDSSGDSRQRNEEHSEIVGIVESLAKQYEGDSLKLLSLLRTLESLHREIREKMFQESLPNNRQHLYDLLKDIEESGGWPYIKRMRIQDLFVNYPEPEEEDFSTEASEKINNL